ncbi:MAG: hypothetical protein V4632_18275 [Pseudomonadota bacterium]
MLIDLQMTAKAVPQPGKMVSSNAFLRNSIISAHYQHIVHNEISNKTKIAFLNDLYGFFHL